MFKLFIEWYRKRFSDPHLVSLLVVIVLLFVLIYFFNKILLPILIAVVLSYLLDKPVSLISKFGISRTISVILILTIFIAIVSIMMMILMPLIWQQGVSLIRNIPNMLTLLNNFLITLPEHYPELIDVGLFDSIIRGIQTKTAQLGNTVIQISIVSLLGVISIIINAVLIPIIMFFLLKDKDMIWRYCAQLLPKNRQVIDHVAHEMDQQIGNYIVGNVLQIIILSVWVYIPFWYFGLDYGLLLAVIIGVSAIIPYVGVIISTIPVVFIALFQFGFSAEFGYLMVSYAAVQILDANLVVPYLFSEKLNLHPLVIILAVIIFGGLWGFWGIFFAIPLATLVKAIINAWSKTLNVINESEQRN